MNNSKVKDTFNSQISLANLPSNYKKTFILYTNLLKYIGIDIFGPKLGRANVNASARLFIFNLIFIPFLIHQFSAIFKLKAGNFLEGAAIMPICLMFALSK